MILWKSLDIANGAPKYIAMSLGAGAGRTAQAANQTSLFNNTNPNAFKQHYDANVVGIFAASKAEMANTTGEGHKVRAPGWNLRRAGQGPILSALINAPGTGFSNGETITTSNGAGNGTLVIVANSSTNATGLTVRSGGLFTNAAVVAFTFNRERHVANVTCTGTGLTYANTDTILASNGTINATATVSTNSTGGLANTSFTITNPGIWPSGTANSAVVVVALAANGAASNGTGLTFAVNLANSTGGSVNALANSVILGGRAGRIRYECLAENSSMGNSGLILTTLTAAGGAITGYANTDLVVASNGTSNGFATISTNSTGGFVTANLTITSTGLWPRGTTNSQVAVAVKAANGAASNGSGATITANLVSAVAFTYLPY